MYLLNAYLLTAESGKEYTFCTKTMMDALLSYIGEAEDPITSATLVSSDVLSEFNAQDVSGDIPSTQSNGLYCVSCDDRIDYMIATSIAEALQRFMEYKQKEPYQLYRKASGVLFPQEPIE